MRIRNKENRKARGFEKFDFMSDFLIFDIYSYSIEYFEYFSIQ